MRVDKKLWPITLTPVISKSFEWYAYEWILKIIDGMLSSHQYGSHKGNSTTIMLMELIHEWLAVVEALGPYVRILLINFRKAFDRVDHSIILTK